MTAHGRIVVTLSLLLGSSGCVGSTAEPVGYEPVPDSELFTEVQRLPGVLEADVSYDDSFTNGRNYLARLRVGRRADVADILDSTTASRRSGPAGREPHHRSARASGRAGSALSPGARPVDLVVTDTFLNPQEHSGDVTVRDPRGTGEVPQDAEPLPRPPGVS